MSAATATDLRVAEKRSKCVELARTGMSYRSIAPQVGYASTASVADRIREHFAELRPSAEVTEDLRSLQGEQLDAMLERLWPHLEVAEDRLATVDRILRVQDRKARLFGLDLQAPAQVNLALVVTRESLGELVFGQQAAIEGTPTEVVSDGE